MGGGSCLLITDGLRISHRSKLSQVPHRPVGVPAGDPLQHGFQRALTLLHRVGLESVNNHALSVLLE
ncbi:hypothetical protein INR49_024218 [Caranx melampygus]|nr:hypothetical protein INR49_024218 [Caranx melampygus]